MLVYLYEILFDLSYRHKTIKDFEKCKIGHKRCIQMYKVGIYIYCFLRLLNLLSYIYVQYLDRLDIIVSLQNLIKQWIMYIIQ